jgi:hypothetical protein
MKFSDINFEELDFPEKIIQKMKNWKVIHKSPYSNSFYNSEDISWNHKPDGSLRVSDHWNFADKHGVIHCKTDRHVDCKHRVTIGRFDSKTDKYKIIKSVLRPSEEKRAKIINEFIKDPERIKAKSELKKKIRAKEIRANVIYSKHNIKTGIVDLYTGNSIRLLDENLEVNYLHNYLQSRNKPLEIKLFENNIEINNPYKEEINKKLNIFNIKELI